VKPLSERSNTALFCVELGTFRPKTTKFCLPESGFPQSRISAPFTPYYGTLYPVFGCSLACIQAPNLLNALKYIAYYFVKILNILKYYNLYEYPVSIMCVLFELIDSFACETSRLFPSNKAYAIVPAIITETSYITGNRQWQKNPSTPPRPI